MLLSPPVTETPCHVDIVFDPATLNPFTVLCASIALSAGMLPSSSIAGFFFYRLLPTILFLCLASSTVSNRV